MKKPEFTNQLREALNELEEDKVACRNVKRFVLNNIAESAELRRDEALMSALKKLHRKPNKQQSLKVKNLVMSEIQSQKNHKSFDLLQFVFIVSRKGLALGFSFALLAMTLIPPLQYGSYTNILPPVQAAYLECNGKVTLNGVECIQNEIIRLDGGDMIQTGERSEATIFYEDYSVVRLEENTDAMIDDHIDEHLIVNKGELWINTPIDTLSDSVKVSTPVLKAKIPQGSAGLSVKRNITDIYADTAVLQVQIDNAKGSTDVVTVSPDQGAVKVRRGRDKANVRSFTPNVKQQNWVTKNQEKDVTRREDIKKENLVKQEVIAGALPGGMTDYVDKIAASARTAMIWDSEAKHSAHLAQLDELFSETLILLEKGDQTTALKNFEVYRGKLASLLVQEFDTLSIIESDKLQKNAVQLFNEHYRSVSMFDSEDLAYVLRDHMNKITVNLEKPTEIIANQQLAESIVNAKIAEAHKSVTDGDEDLAEELLRDASESIVQSNNPDASLLLLKDIKERSEKLEPLVNEIKRHAVVQLKSQEVEKNIDIVTDVIKGSAVNTDTETGEDEELVSSVVVGQAIKPQDNSY